MRQPFRIAAALAPLLFLFTSTASRADTSGTADAAGPAASPAVVVEVVVEDVESAPADVRATDYLVTVERVLQGGVPGSSLIVRVPAGRQISGLRAGGRAILSLAPARDGSFRLRRVLEEIPGGAAGAAAEDPAGPMATAVSEMPAAAAPAVDRIEPAGSFAFAGEEPVAGTATEKIVTGILEGNGFVSKLAVLSLEGVGGRVTVLLKDLEGETVGDPAVLTLGPRVLRLLPLSQMFPDVVSHRGPFTVQLVSNGILFTASALLLEIESEDQIFIPATPMTGGDATTGEMFFPRVARMHGPFDTFLTSRLSAFNPAGEGRLLTLEFWERGQDNTAPRTAYRFVEAGQALVVKDILLDLFGVDDGTGALHLAWSGPAGPAPRVISLTFAGAADGQGKRFGALVDAATAAGAIRRRGRAVGAGQNEVSRSSFGTLNLAAGPTTLRLTLADAEGHQLSTAQVGLKPRQHLERNVAGLFPGIGNGGDWVVETEVMSGGPVLTYLAHIDAGGDISYVPGHAR